MRSLKPKDAYKNVGPASATDVSLYHLLTAVISFNVLMRDALRWDANERKQVPQLSDKRMWRDVESRTGIRTFTFVLFLVPFSFILSQILSFVMNFLLWGIVPLLTGGPIWSWPFKILDLMSVFYWPYLSGCLGGLLSTFMLTMHVHHFQLVLFKVRLEFDRIHNEDAVPQWKSLRLLIEEYLFHQFTIRRSTEAWQLILVASLLGLVLYIAVALIGFIMYRDVIIFVWGVFAALVFLFVLFLIAKLNGELSSVREILVYGSSEDWKLYNGRDELIKYFDSNPTQFTIYGFPITFRFLVGVATSLITANFGAGVAVLGLQKTGSASGIMGA